MATVSRPSAMSPETHVLRHRVSPPIILLVSAISAYIFLNAGSLQTLFITRVAFGLMIATICGLFAYGLLQRRMVPHIGAALGAWAAVMTIQVFQYPISPKVLSQHVFTDFAIMLVPVGIALTLGMWVRSRDEIFTVVLIVVAAAATATIFAWLKSPAMVRIEAPAILAIVGAWIVALLPLPRSLGSLRVRRRLRVIALVTVPLMLAVTIASRSRTALGVWVLAGVICFVLPGVRRTPRSAALVGVACISLVGFLGLADRVTSSGVSQELLTQVRVDSFIAGHGDASSQSRIAEAGDVMRTMKTEGGGFDYLLGFGHGSAYIPAASYIVPNVDRESGRVHHIHITPVMIFFRYGLVGLAVFLTLIFSVIVASVRSFNRRRDALSSLILVAMLMYLLDLMVRNSFVDPGLSLVMAVALVAERLRPVEVGGTC